MSEAQDEATLVEFWRQPWARQWQKLALGELRRKGIRSDDDVRALIQWLKEPKVGTRVNCTEKDHRAPFRFVADVLTERSQNWIAWANRAGGKTYLAGLIAWTQASSIPGLEMTVLGGSLEQSGKLYEAMDSFWGATQLQDEYLAFEPTKRKTIWKNRSEVTLLTASTKSTRGPHPHRLFLDEVDEIKEDVYRSALSQPMAKRGIKAGLGQLSTNHKFGGMMDKAVEKARESGTPIYKWCVFEILSSCRDYTCSTCQLSPWCPGEHMKRANGYYNIADFINKLENLNEQTLMVEWFCRKIGRDDLVYGAQFEEQIHAGLGIPGPSIERPGFVSIDWGGTDPFTLGFWQEFEIGWVRTDEIYLQNSTNQRLISEAKAKPWWAAIKEGVADPSRPDLIKEWAAEGIRLVAADNAVDIGIETTRNAMAPLLGRPRFYINPRCRAWLGEVKTYMQKNGRPVDRSNHTMDETRYFIMWKIKAPRRKGRVFTAKEEKATMMRKTEKRDMIMFQRGGKADESQKNPEETPENPKDAKALGRENLPLPAARRGRVFFAGQGPGGADPPSARIRTPGTGRPPDPQAGDD